MDGKRVSSILFIIMCISFIWGCVMLNKSHDKMTNYHNSEYTSFSQNAYVGGDAYNYIINGTYATTFCVAGMGCMIIAILSFIGGCYFAVFCNDGKETRNQGNLPSLD